MQTTRYGKYGRKRSGREIATDIVTDLVVRPPFDFINFAAKGAGFAFGAIIISRKLGVLPLKK